MPLVRISAEAEASIRKSRFAGNDIDYVAPNDDGSYSIKFNLQQASFEGETLSDAIVRLCNFAEEHNLN